MQYLWDADDRRFIDLLGMNVCISVGHSHPKVVAAATAQAADLTHCTTMFYHPVPAHLAEELAATMPQGRMGGSFHQFRGRSGRSCDDHGPHLYGNLDLLACGAAIMAPLPRHSRSRGYRHGGIRACRGMSALLPSQPVSRYFGENAGAAPYLDEIERVIAASTTGRLPVCWSNRSGLWRHYRNATGLYVRCGGAVRAAGGLYIADEVQSGFGRTGDHMWGFEADNVIPDIVVMAKGIGNGFPLGAVIAQRHIAAPMADKFMFHTYGPTRPAVLPDALCLKSSAKTKSSRMLRKSELHYISVCLT